jgi:hypothetical protein
VHAWCEQRVAYLCERGDEAGHFGTI